MSLQMLRQCAQRFGALAAFGVIAPTALATGPLPSLGPASDFAVLALGGSMSTFGQATINSSTSIIGDVGYGAYVQSTTNQKVDSFIGAAWVHSTANFTYTAATYQPTGGILIGIGGPGDPIDGKLNAATAMVINAGPAFAALSPTLSLGALASDQVIASTGDVNVISLSSLSYNNNTLTLQSRAGHTDFFVFNVAGNFDFSQSDVLLSGTDASHVLFNFTGASAAITVNKSNTTFNGTLLAPYIGQSIIYHNPASFNGAIYGYNIALHSDFNINHAGFVPAPAAGWLIGAAGLLGSRRRRLA